MGWFDENPVSGGTTDTPQMPPASYQAPSVQPSQPTAGGGDWQQTFMRIMQGLPATPENLISKERELAAAGITVRRNAEGVAGKVGLPDGTVVDTVVGAMQGGGQGPWAWNVDHNTGPGGQALGALGSTQGSAQGGVNYLARQGTLADTPGYQFIMKEAMGALDKSASSRGTLLTGGHLKDLQDRAAGIASTTFGQEFDRNLQLGQLGFNAATNQGAYGSSYGSQVTDLTTGAGNAQAAGTVASGNAWGGALGNIGQSGMDAWGLYKYGPRRPGGGYGGGTSGGAGGWMGGG